MNAAGAQLRLGVGLAGVTAAWDGVAKGELVKFGGGFYVGKFGAEQIAMSGTADTDTVGFESLVPTPLWRTALHFFPPHVTAFYCVLRRYCSSSSTAFTSICAPFTPRPPPASSGASVTASNTETR